VARARPGGKDAIIFGTPVDNPQPALFVMDLASNALRRLTPSGYPVDGIKSFAVSHDGQSILATRAADAMVRLTSISISAKPLERTLFTATSQIRQFDGGPDGSVYATISDRPSDLIQISANGGASERIAYGQKFRSV
jgi:hypothetical protein